jgi:hypothetical protein
MTKAKQVLDSLPPRLAEYKRLNPSQPSSVSVLFGLGTVVYAFSTLDHALSQLCGKLMDSSEEVTEAVLAEIDLKRKVFLIRSLLHRMEPHRAILERLLSNAEEAANERNILIHSTYHITDVQTSTYTRKKTTAKKAIKRASETKSATTLMQTAEFTFDTAFDIFFHVGVYRNEAEVS